MRNRLFSSIERRVAIAAALFFFALKVGAQPRTIHGGNGITLPPPPVANVRPVTDDYNGTKITDNYRWLEDAKSPHTRAWIDAENAYTQKYLSQAKIRPEIVKGLTALLRVDSFTIPQLHGGKYFFEKRLAEENPMSIYMRDGWKGEDERLIDATKLSADQNTSLEILDISKSRAAAARAFISRRRSKTVRTGCPSSGMKPATGEPAIPKRVNYRP